MYSGYVCPIAWRTIGLDERLKSLQTMLLAEKGLVKDDVVSTANAVYAIAKTVQALRSESSKLEPAPLLRLYLANFVMKTDVEF